MNDFHQDLAIDQRARGTITVLNYDLLDGKKATGVVTVVDYTLLAGKTVTVNGTVLTEGVEWNAATDNDTTAASLETAIEAVTNINSTVLAAVITVEAAAVGAAGNAYTLATNAAVEGLTISGATLTGGQDAGTFTIGSDTITEGSDFNAATSNNQTATNIAAAIEALTGVGATANGAVVTITADASGTGGNAKALTTTAPAEAVTLSGATLAGGVAASYSDVFDMEGVEDLKNLEIVQYLTAVAGTSTPTITSTPQYSMDKVKWFDHSTLFATGFTVIDTPQKLDLDFTALFCRIKHVASGTNCVATVHTDMLAK